MSKAVLSDVPSSAALAAVSLLALSVAARGGTAARWALVGCATGLATMVRTQSIVIVVPLGLIVLLTSRKRPRDLVALLAGALAGMLPLLIYDWRVFGSPLATGYGYWVPGSFFGAQYVLGTPAGGGSDPNATFYGRALLGQGDLYPWPVAVLAALGIARGIRTSGTPRILVLMTLGLVGALYALQTVFFWQAERFLLPALPLVAALAALPLAPSSGRLARTAGVALVLLALVFAFRHSYAPPDRDWGEVAGLRELAIRTERNAVVLARTNGAFFEQLLRSGGADRLWMPLGLDEWQLAIRMHRLTSHGAVAGARWIVDPVGAPLRPAPLRETVRGLLREGRPVYVWSFRSSDVPFFSELLAALRAEFDVGPGDSVGRWAVFRVSARP
jgi:4-amino-4-deoxy-L-arabinose transferase-like glycosyltransferase